MFKGLNITCTGKLTRLIFGARKDTDNDEEDNEGIAGPEIEIWRPQNNQYVKVHGVNLTSYKSNAIKENVYSYTLESPLSVKPNDIVGIKQQNDTQFLLYYQMYNGPFNYKFTNGGQLAQIPDRNNYPLLSIVGKSIM